MVAVEQMGKREGHKDLHKDSKPVRHRVEIGPQVSAFRCSDG